MLSEKEICQRVKALWDAMTNGNWTFENYPLYFEKPIKGCQPSGKGCYNSYHVYIMDENYIYSYSERGSESILFESDDFNDIEFELAFVMAGELAFWIIKDMKWKKQNKYIKKGKLDDWQMNWEIRLELLKKAGASIYQKAKVKYEHELQMLKSGETTVED